MRSAARRTPPCSTADRFASTISAARPIRHATSFASFLRRQGCEGHARRSLLRQILEAGEANVGSGGFSNWRESPAERRVDGEWPAARRRGTFTVAMPEFLLTGLELRMAFLTRDKVRSVEELRDIRLILIEELRRRFPGRTGLRDLSGGLRYSFKREAAFSRQ